MTTRERTGLFTLSIVGLLMALGAVLRLYRLNTGLWFDEIITLIVSVRPPLLETMAKFPSTNDHPLYSVLAHLAITWLGEAPWTFRLPSVLFGVAAIPMLYMVGRMVTTTFEALLAASILTVSYHHIWFSQNARGYTLLLLCVLVSTYLLLRWLADGRRPHVIAYAVVVALGSYTHLTMVFVCVGHFMVIAFEWFHARASSQPQPDWKQAGVAFGGAAFLTVLLYAPKLGDVQTFFVDQVVTGTEVATPMWALWQAVQGLQLGFGTLWGIAIGGLICGAGIWSFFKRNAAGLLLFVVPVPVTLALGIAMGRPIFPRFVFFAMGFGLLITVRGAAAVGEWFAARIGSRITPRQAGMVAAALLTAGAVALSIRSLPYGYRYPKQDYEQAAAFVERSKQEQDLVSFVGVTSAVPFRDYLGKSWVRVEREPELHALRVRGHDVWVVFTFPAYIVANQPALWAVIENDCHEVARFEGTVGGGAIRVARCAPSGS